VKKPTFQRPSLSSVLEDRDGLRNIGFFTAQPFNPADSPRELQHTLPTGKQQISFNARNVCC